MTAIPGKRPRPLIIILYALSFPYPPLFLYPFIPFYSHILLFFSFFSPFFTLLQFLFTSSFSPYYLCIFRFPVFFGVRLRIKWPSVFSDLVGTLSHSLSDDEDLFLSLFTYVFIVISDAKRKGEERERDRN